MKRLGHSFVLWPDISLVTRLLRVEFLRRGYKLIDLSIRFSFSGFDLCCLFFCLCSTKLVKVCLTLFRLYQINLSTGWLSHRLTLGKVHLLFVTLAYFRLDRFVQPVSLTPVIILFLYLLVSIHPAYFCICEF